MRREPSQRRGRVDFINPVLERDLGRLRPCRMVIETGAAQAQQFRLLGEWRCIACALKQRQTLRPRQGRGQIFF